MIPAFSPVMIVPPVPPTTWDPTGKGTLVTLSNGNLDATSSTTWSGVRSTSGKTSGKWYCEVRIVTVIASNIFIGVMNNDTAGGASMDVLSTPQVGQVRDDGFNASSSGFAISGLSPALGSLANNDIVQVAVDVSNKMAWLGTNNIYTASGNPGAGTNPTWTWTSAYTIFVGATLGANPFIRIQPNAAVQTFTPPTGFSAWS
jgi:hypothetical protein